MKIKEQHFGPDHRKIAATPSTSLAMRMGPWETIWHKEGLAGASFEDQRAALWQCPCSLGRPSHRERLDGVSLSSLQQVFLCARVSQFGPDHLEVAATLNGLASAHGALGDYGTKKGLLERALKIKEQHFGPDHPKVAATLNDLGNAHGALGDPRTQKDLLEHLGADHPDVALTLHNLGNAHGALGDYGTKKGLLEHLGADQPDVALTFHM